MKIDYEKAWCDLKQWLGGCDKNEYKSCAYMFTLERMDKIIKKQQQIKRSTR